MVTISPVGTSETTLTANELKLHVRFDEKFFKSYTIPQFTSPTIEVTYTNGIPLLVSGSVFVPITANLVVSIPLVGGALIRRYFTETFTTIFQDQTTLPTVIDVEKSGELSEFIRTGCCKVAGFKTDSSITVTMA